jgi:hypothetical protein
MQYRLALLLATLLAGLSTRDLAQSSFDARYMSGGHFAWKAARGPVRLFE